MIKHIDDIKIEENTFTEKDITKINILLQQLSPKISEITYKKLLDLARKSTIICARSEGEIVAICNLIEIDSIGATYSRCADVVVDEKFRSMQIGRMMMQHAIKLSEKRGYPYTIVQTQVQKRPKAVTFYKSLGYKKLANMRLFILDHNK